MLRMLPESAAQPQLRAEGLSLSHFGQHPQHSWSIRAVKRSHADALSELAALFTRQRGLITHGQATSAGLNRTAISRLVRSGKWEVVRPRVFRKAAKKQTEEQALLAVCLWIGEGAVVSHHSAARIHGLDVHLGLPEVTTGRQFETRAVDVKVHRIGTLDDKDRRVLRGIPVTTGARTIIDLASCLDDEPLAIAVEEAWRKEIATPSWVSNRLDELAEDGGGRGRPSRVLAQILADCRTRKKALESALEVRVWRLFRKHDLPLPVPNWEFQDDYGQPGRIDFAFPGQSLAIECDGFASHGEREAFENDRVRTQRLVALGWRVFAVTWRHLDQEPLKVVSRIREALSYRTVSNS
jgi:very-short-patch-repair endonuclease